MKFELYTKSSETGDFVFPLVTEGNEAGVKALTSHVPGAGFYAEQALDAHLTLNSNELRLIYFALLAQRDSYWMDLKSEMETRDADQNFEDATFVAGELSKTLLMLFQMCDDHDTEYKKVVTAFMNV